MDSEKLQEAAFEIILSSGMPEHLYMKASKVCVKETMKKQRYI